MNVTYVVSIDLAPAVDQSGYLDDYAASVIAMNSGDYPTGATIRLSIGNARGGVPDRLVHVLERAGEIILEGSNATGLRILGQYLSGANPYAVI